MRIILFPKFILTEATQQISLKNCSVVIDGSHFLHYTYKESKIPFVFGGEMDKYEDYLKELFNKFRQARVKCYIVSKGGDSDIDKKISKFQHYIYDFDSDEFVPPIFLKDVCAQAIEDMRMEHVTCVTETKDDCVALAQKLNCPLIANDISYCFRIAQYVLNTPMKLNKRTNSIECRLYTLHNFLQKYSLTEEKLVIFATLSDSHIFPRNFFDTLLRKWAVLDDNLYIQNKNLICWLSSHSEDEARDGVSSALSSDEQNKFWSNYDNMLRNMRQVEVGLATNYVVNSGVWSQRPVPDPEWFEKGVISNYIAPTYVNLYKWKVIEGSWAVEDICSRDSLLLSVDIIKYVHNLLTDFKRDTIKLYQNADHFITIDTEDSSIRKPIYINCKHSVFESGWATVRRFRLFEHFLSENNISCAVLDKAPADAAVLLAALVYFARKKQCEHSDVTTEVYAVLLSYVMLKVRRSDVSDGDHCASRATAQYFQYDADEARTIFDGEALTRFVEFQYCMQHLNYLNTLCGSPYEGTRYARVYNGTFIFKIFCAMRDRDRDVFVNELFQSAPSVLADVRRLIDFYTELFTTK